MKRGIAILCALTFPCVAFAEADFGASPYQRPVGLVTGGSFIDLIRPIPVCGKLETDGWGGDNVKPREMHNGIEDAKWSYWCISVIHGPDGKEHLFGARWPESSSKGHGTWPRSQAYHAVSDSPTGPFVVKEELGPGHNTVVYQAKDGTYVVYVIDGSYQSKNINGPWTKVKLEFDNRGMAPVNMSNLTFTRREDGSFLMISRTGQVWISEDGLKPYRHISGESVYPKINGRFEDPVVWRDNVQYNLIVNDWFGRTAYYLRSKDGLHWTWDPGKSYDPDVVRHPDGTKEGWVKLERPQVRQDELGRATHLYLAAIDCPKNLDKGGDNHSSKSLALPLTVNRRLAILNETAITADTREIRVEIQAEDGFNPQTDVVVQSLTFGASEQVNFGKGCKVLKSEKSGKNLVVTFDGTGNGLKDDDFSAKLLGKTSQGELLIGYARLPGQPLLDPLPVARPPVFNRKGDGTLGLSVTVENFGLAKSAPAQVKVVFKEKRKVVYSATAAIPALDPYGAATVEVSGKSDMLTAGSLYDIEVIVNPASRRPEFLPVKSVKIP